MKTNMFVKGDFMKMRMVGNEILLGGFCPEDKEKLERRRRRVEKASKELQDGFDRILQEHLEKLDGNKV